MFYLLINGQRTGPYQAQEIQNLLRQNSIGYETQFWRDGMMNWESIGSQKQLFESSYRQPQMYQQQEQYRPPQPMYQQQPLVVQQLYVANKSRVTFILLGLFLGGLGIHNFYAGYSGKAVTQLLLNLFLFWTIVVPLGIGIWVIVEVCTVDHDALGNRMA